MRLVPITCPRCGASLSLRVAQRLCSCDYCGSRLLVHWQENQPIDLKELDKSKPDVRQVLLADVRLRYIDDDIAQAEKNLIVARIECEAARAHLRKVQGHCVAQKNSDRNVFFLFAFAALVLWRLALTSFRGKHESSVIMVAAVIATLLALAALSSWRAARVEAKLKCAAAERAVQEAERHEREVLAQLEDLEKEKQLCQETVRSFRYRPDE